MADAVKPILWNGKELQLLDQRILPHREEWVTCSTADQVAAAIAGMIVRGAPAIGIAAAFGMVLAADDDLDAAAERLKRSRPTAVNLAWAVDRMAALAATLPLHQRRARLATEAETIHREDIEANRAIGRHGAALLGQKVTLLTHCNAGALATGGYGTALGVVRAAAESGRHVAVFADETRPWLQGSRLTAWELQKDGIDVTLISDNMAGHFFRLGTFDAVIVGADRIAANGDVANKIGTYTLAVLAKAHGVPFYVAAPWSTVDAGCASGAEIPIEERAGEEVLRARGAGADGELVEIRIGPEGVAARHPAFDVTPAELITAIITERGVSRPPFSFRR